MSNTEDFYLYGTGYDYEQTPEIAAKQTELESIKQEYTDLYNGLVSVVTRLETRIKQLETMLGLHPVLDIYSREDGKEI